MKKAQVRPASALQTPKNNASIRKDEEAVSPTAPVTSAVPACQKYSIERLLALEEYSRTKSLWQVLSSAVGTPLLPVCIVLVFQLPRLAPPEAGLLANWVYVVERGGIGGAIGSECTLRVVCALMPELIPVLPWRTRLAVNICIGLVYVVMSVLLSQTWGFPVPFTASIIDPISSLTWSIIIQLIVRPVINAGNDELKNRFEACFIYAGVISFMSIAYPAYMALFFAVGTHYPTYQPFVTLLVPSIKWLLRKIVEYAVSDWEELTPVMVIFSVEFFSSLYQAMSVQASSSFATTAVIIAIDFIVAVRGQWELYETTSALRVLLQETGSESMLPAVARICIEPNSLLTSSDREHFQLRAIRVYSTLRSDLMSDSTRCRLEKLNDSNVFSSPKSIAKTPSGMVRSVGRPIAASLRSIVRRLGLGSNKVNSSNSQGSTSSVIRKTSKCTEVNPGSVVVEATRVLFRTETLLLTEYLECFIPLFYAVNVVFVSLSPNAAYYPSLEATRTAGGLGAVLLNIFVLFALEVVSFVVLNVVLWKRLRFSPLHQLSFVLEHEATLMQANMLFVFLLTFFFDLTHSGEDFSFQFQWLHKRDPHNA